MAKRSPQQPLKIQYLPTSALRPAENNPRVMPPREMEALKNALSHWGFVDPIVARPLRDGTLEIIGGHQRVTAAQEMGIAEVPVVVIDVSEVDAMILNEALNRIHGTWDEPQLALHQAAISLLGGDLTLTGFTASELLHISGGKTGLTDPDDVPDPPPEPITKTGDLWQCGTHRLLCGDATKPEDVERLMAGEKAALMATDPTYLVNYRGGSHPQSRVNRAEVKDKHWDDYHDPEMAVEFFAKFLRLGLEHLAPNSAIYQWHANMRQGLVQQAWHECGLLVHQVIIWAKSRGVRTHSHYMWQHEPCFYGWVEGKQPSSKPPPNVTTVWNVDQRGDSDNIHPTQKPVELFERPISYHTEADEVCYEPFLGSGTTMIACERLGRRCYGMEIGPHYVDVAVKRWEEFTGGKAERI